MQQELISAQPPLYATSTAPAYLCGSSRRAACVALIASVVAGVHLGPTPGTRTETKPTEEQK